jgi:hypothetical protein
MWYDVSILHVVECRMLRVIIRLTTNVVRCESIARGRVQDACDLALLIGVIISTSLSTQLLFPTEWQTIEVQTTMVHQKVFLFGDTLPGLFQTYCMGCGVYNGVSLDNEANTCTIPKTRATLARKPPKAFFYAVEFSG